MELALVIVAFLAVTAGISLGWKYIYSRLEKQLPKLLAYVLSVILAVFGVMLGILLFILVPVALLPSSVFVNEEPVNNSDNVVTGSPTIEETRLELEADLSEKVFQLNENILPLNEFRPENDFQLPSDIIYLLGRCSSLQMVNLRLDDPDPDQKFDDMRFFMERISEVIDLVSPSEYENQKGVKSVMVHEYFLDRYQEVEDANWLSDDRSICSEMKTALEDA